MKPPIQLLKEELARHGDELIDIKYDLQAHLSLINIPEMRKLKRETEKMIRLYKHSIKLLEK